VDFATSAIGGIVSQSRAAAAGPSETPVVNRRCVFAILLLLGLLLQAKHRSLSEARVSEAMGNRLSVCACGWEWLLEWRETCCCVLWVYVGRCVWYASGKESGVPVCFSAPKEGTELRSCRVA
jgi:hypothetical protein